MSDVKVAPPKKKDLPEFFTS